MSSDALHLMNEPEWRSGFTNMLNKEYALWWKTRTWWIQSLIWLLILNGLVALILWGPLLSAESPPSSVLGYSEGLPFYLNFKGIFVAIGVIIISQGIIIGEKQSGTAEWVLSNPVSRVAFILSKLIATATGILITIVLLQDLIAYIQFSFHGGRFLPFLPYLSAMSLQSLHLFYYLALTLMLGTFFNSVGAVIGISIAHLFGLPLLWNYAPSLVRLLPTSLPDISVLLALEQPLAPYWYVPILVTLALSFGYVLVAIWRFKREEF